MAFKVGLLGLGTVGTGTVEILHDPAQRHPLLQELVIHKVGVRSLDKTRSLNLPADLLTTDLEAIVTDPEIDIVVEVMGGLEPARSLILKAIAHKKHVVTANKAAIARFGDEIFTAASEAGVYVLLEAAVGGGIPVIEPLKRSLCANRINTVTGIVNGTTNYILTRMQTEGGNFGEILADAQQLGYAEADPTADVDGLDAADKIAILASLAFSGRIKLSEVHCEGIRQVGAADIAYAEKLIEGDPIGQVMFFGRGAGAGPTASAVVADILNIAAILKVGRGQVTQMDGTPLLDPLLACSHQHYCTIAPMSELVTRFYARFLTQDYPGVIGKLGTCFGDHQVSLESVVQTGLRDELAGTIARLVAQSARVGSRPPDRHCLRGGAHGERKRARRSAATGLADLRPRGGARPRGERAHTHHADAAWRRARG